MDEQLSELSHWPAELLDVPAVLIQRVLARPTLIHLPGDAAEPIFVSILLHGNEDVGLKAIQQFLLARGGDRLPRALSVFIGNVEAATAGVRFLPHQLDYNRVWPHPGQSLALAEPRLMLTVLQRMLQRRVAASIDLHNNSGRNPHYSCVCSLSEEHLRLASMFGPRAMFFTRPLGVQTAAFAEHCPAITCECGPIGDAQGVRAAVDLLDRLMSLSCERPLRETLLAESSRPSTRSVELYRTVGTWRILPQATLSMNSHTDSQVFLRPDLDLLNFERLEMGTELGQSTVELEQCMEVRDGSGCLVTTAFLMRDADGTVRLKQSTTPSMLTTSLAAIRQDCVGYFLEPIVAT